MTPYQKHPCELTRRMAEDMIIRNLAQSTIDAYTYHARRFAAFIAKPLGRATVEDVRTFQLYLIQQKKVAYSTFNQAVCTLRFLYQDRCREQLEAVEGWRLEEPSADSSKEAFAQSPDQVCEHCGSDRIELVQDTPKPSWAEIFWREDDRCPGWYADRQRESHRRLWTASYGTDFYDWYVETQVESAEGIEREPIAMVQLPLAGFTGDFGYPQSYLVDSF
ncbi:site-specific integrase [Rubripirellula lacrimiformis]|nr:site-specific integrase [Rubripirellula lacrimiformis]